MNVTAKIRSIYASHVMLAVVLLSTSGALARGTAPAVTVPSTKVGEVTVRLPGIEPDTIIPVTTAFAGSPTGGMEEEYASIVMKVMPEAFSPLVQVREIVLAPFKGEEYVLSLQPERDHWRLFALRSTSWLWRYTTLGIAQEWELNHKRLRADGYRRVKLVRCSVELDHALGGRIVALWQGMLRDAIPHPNPEPPPFDANEVFLFANVGGKIIAGEPPTRPREHVLAFLDVAVAMEDVCIKPGRLTRAAVVRNVDRFPSATIAALAASAGDFIARMSTMECGTV